MKSNLRLRDSVNTVKGLIDRAIELGHNGIAFTEHETVANAIEIEEYWDEIKKDYPNFKIIRGNEIYLVRNGLNAENFNKDKDSYTHFILLALDEIGHKQIREISTRAWQRSYMARGMRRVPTYYQDLFDIIGANPGHVIGSTACLGGALPTQILRKTDDAKLENWIIQMDNLFSHGNFFLEMQPSNSLEQQYVNKKIVKLSKKLDVPTIITNDAHYLKKEDLEIERIFLNSQGGDREVESFYATTYLMNDEEIHSFLDKQIGTKEIEESYKNIQSIFDRAVEYSLKRPLRIPELPWRPVQTHINYKDWDIMPDYIKTMPTLKKFLCSAYKSDRYLVNAVIDGIKQHSDLQNERAYNELELCLQDTWVSSEVNNARWSAYFLNLQKLIDICWEAGTLVGCGRGSGVGFLLLYCLDITQINPLRETTKTFRFRFLNPERVSVLDIDSDISGLNRAKVLDYIRKYYGQDHVANVLTLRTEKSKSAILAAARGLNIDVDIAQYISSLIPSERGILWSLHDCMYGNEDENRKPIKQFVIEMTENYPEIWRVVERTEGLIVGMGEHAGGLVLVDEPFTETTALMRAPNGDIITQFELHTLEKCSNIKLDLLSVEAIDKIQICLELLQQYGYIDKTLSLREAYNQTIGIYNLERNNDQMWKMVCDHKISSLFQLVQQSGIKGIEVLKPSSVDDLAVLNSAIRLMAQEKGGEMPIDKLARFKQHPEDWNQEIIKHGLNVTYVRNLLDPILATSYGLSIAQEQFMQMVQLPELGGMSLTESDALRKSIAKKNPAAYDKWISDYRKICMEKGIDKRLIEYIIELISMSKGYGFNQSHTLAYSLIALQEMNLAFKYPIIFWNCACLISDSGGIESTEDEEEEYIEPIEQYYNELEDFNEEEDTEIENSYDEEDCDGYPSEVIVLKDGKKKKKVKSTNFGKIATAIGKMTSEGIKVSSPDINHSTFTFSPDVDTNQIRFGLSGITRIGGDLIKTIIDNRPYENIEDFLTKVKLQKPQMINLIKAGAFDKFGNSREEVMDYYINLIADKKKRVTLQNMAMLINFDLLPPELDLEKKIFNFNKYLKKFKDGADYIVDEIAFRFYSEHFDVDKLYPYEDNFKISQTTWDNMYKKLMDPCRNYIKAHHDELLNAINQRLKDDLFNKYCSGNISKWEMEAVSCYFHNHELNQVNQRLYGFEDYFEIGNESYVERMIPIKGKLVPIYHLSRIIGTVLDKDKNKRTISLLTTTGVVNVKIFGDVFTYYDKQISERGIDGHKHVIRKSEFSRGNKIIITGIKRDDMFLAKKYSKTPWHLIETIEEISEDGTITTFHRS